MSAPVNSAERIATAVTEALDSGTLPILDEWVIAAFLRRARRAADASSAKEVSPDELAAELGMPVGMVTEALVRVKALIARAVGPEFVDGQILAALKQAPSLTAAQLAETLRLPVVLIFEGLIRLAALGLIEDACEPHDDPASGRSRLVRPA